ncbi:MAG TPA: LamG-like jellyroll fold domain-containing protein, partial [Terriglobales bacterium]
MRTSPYSAARNGRCFAVVTALLLAGVVSANAQIVPTNDPPVYGPYNAVILQGGDGLRKPMVARDTVLRADSPWTIYGWVQTDAPITAPVLVAGIGDVAAEYSRYLGLDSGKLMLWMGADNSFSAPAIITPGKWKFLAATFDGSVFRLYSDGAQVGQGSLTLGRVAPVLQIAPPLIPWPNGQHFGGKTAGLTLTREALTADHIKQIASAPPAFSVLAFEDAAKPWPVQTRGQAGYRAPQDPSTWPKSRAPIPSPIAKSAAAGRIGLQADGDNQWTIAGGWQMAAAPKVSASAQEIAKVGFDTKEWLVATVPGTALTTMIDRGIYPDPDYGLNNLVIPESLNKQDYWYRNEFKAPKTPSGRRLTLTFQGINYAAEVLLNGQSLGNIKGAFIRGVFDVTDILKAGQTNVLAVRVSPPPHPGIP